MSRIEELEKRLAKDPQSKVFAQLAEEYRKVGLLEDAINTCREGLGHHPNYFSARVALGRALLESSSFEEAATEFEKVLAQIPDNILANKFLGESYHKLGRLEEAIAKYRVAQALSPEDVEIADQVSQIEAQQASPPPPLPPPIPQQTAEPDRGEPLQSSPVAGGGVNAEPEVIEFETSGGSPMPLVEKPPSPAVKRQVDEMSDAAPVSEEARAIQEEFEQSFPTGVMKRQAREIQNFETTPAPDAGGGPRETIADAAANSRSPVESTWEMEPPPPSGPGASAPDVPVEAKPSSAVGEGAPLPPTSLGNEAAPPELEMTFEASPEEELPYNQPGLASTTLAELYASQGHIEQALNVFRDLLSSRPNDPKIVQRIEDLEILVRARTDVTTPSRPMRDSVAVARTGPQSIQETIRVLEGWLAALRES